MKQILENGDILREIPNYLSIGCYLAYLWAADKFCKKLFNTSKKKEFLFVIFSFIGWLFLNIVNREYSIPYICFMMLNHIFFVVLVLLLFQGDKEKKILAAVILMTILTLVRDFWASFLSCFLLFFYHKVKKMSEPLLGEWDGGLVHSFSLFMVILALDWASMHLMSVFYRKTRKWYIIMAIPFFVTITIHDVAGWGASKGIMVRSGGSMGLYYDQIFSYTEFFVLTALSIFATSFYLFGMEKIYVEQEKSSKYHAQTEIYKMLVEEYKQSEGLRHDMKNHILALSGLFKNKEWEKMGSYLENMEKGRGKAYRDVTGNKVVDALLYHKGKWAEGENIQWECDVQIPKVCSIHSFDFCVLFGNILDNALEACERVEPRERRFVNIQGNTVKKCFLLEVKNSMNEAEKYEEIFTKKKDKTRGIGLENVGDIVHKHQGIMDIKVERGIFRISILIPLKDTIHDIQGAI